MTETRAWMPYRSLIDPGFIAQAIESYGTGNSLSGDNRIVAACFARLLVGSATKFVLSSIPVDGAVEAPTMVDLLEFAVVDAAPTSHVRMPAIDLRRCGPVDIDVRRAHAFREAIIESLYVALRAHVKVSKQLLVSESAVAWYAALRAEIGPGHECVQTLKRQWSEVAQVSDIFWEYTVRDAHRRAVPFLIRKACCLEYKLYTDPRYCATCPLVDHRDAIAWQENRLRMSRTSKSAEYRSHGCTSEPRDVGMSTLRDG